MDIIWIVVLVLTIFTVSYLGYGRYLARFVELDEERETPAHKYDDGQEYVPSKKPVLLGHHYSSIAGGAPIVGPITATFIWGWLPALLWVAIGNPLMGAVHDFTSLSASIRHEGRSIGSIIGDYVGEQGKNMLLLFAFFLIVLVVAVFGLVIGIVFNAFPEAATASLIYIGLALVFGVWLYQLDLSFIGGTVLFVAGIFGSVLVGIEYPVSIFEAAPAIADPADVTVLLGEAPGWFPELLGSPNIMAWLLVVLVYAWVASVLPVWMLLQPRDYLSSFLLYSGVGGALLAVIVGTLFTSTTEPLTTQIGAWQGFFGSDLPAYAIMPLFPLLFITIACGTISGFHSLVSSGTTAKQLDKETDARLIGYGGMLGEGLLATVSICTVVVVALPEAAGGIGLALPNFANGGGVILTAFGIPFEIGAVFMALVLASFLLTSMDTAARLGRYMVEELAGDPTASTQTGIANRYVSTTVIVVLAFILVGSGEWETLWVLFGGANQLLAALALLTATVWLANWRDTKQLASTGLPMAFMVVMTIVGLLWVAGYQVLYSSILGEGPAAVVFETTRQYIAGGAQILIALLLVALGIMLVRLGYTNINRVRGSFAKSLTTDGGTPQDD